MLLFAGVINEDSAPLPYIDEGVFERIGNDDMEALGELYQQTERVLFAYVFSIVKNKEEALDIVQDTYLKIKAAAHLYKPMNKPLAWIFTIARNLSMTRLKGQKRFVVYNEWDNSFLNEYEMDSEDRIVLLAVLERLDESERAIIMLHAVGGMKHREIAESMNLPLATVLSKYSRGLKKLRKYLTVEVDSI